MRNCSDVLNFRHVESFGLVLHAVSVMSPHLDLCLFLNFVVFLSIGCLQLTMIFSTVCFLFLIYFTDYFLYKKK